MRPRALCHRGRQAVFRAEATHRLRESAMQSSGVAFSSVADQPEIGEHWFPRFLVRSLRGGV